MVLSLFVDEGALLGGLYGWKVTSLETPGFNVLSAPSVKISALFRLRECLETPGSNVLSAPPVKILVLIPL